MKKIFIGLTVFVLVAAAVYFAGRTPAPAPYVPPVVAEKADQLPPVQQDAQFPVVNTERLQRYMAVNKKGPSPIEQANETEWRMAAQKLKAPAGSERQPANSK